MHAIVVIDKDARHLAGDARGHERDVAVDVGVVGGDGAQRAGEPDAGGNQCDQQNDPADDLGKRAGARCGARRRAGWSGGGGNRR